MKNSQVEELLYQALETEIGGVQIYRKAIECAQNDDLRKEWAKYLEETENHVRIVNGIFEKIDLDTGAESPGREIVRRKGKALVDAMEVALSAGDGTTAQLVAAECVVDAETKDHANWELIGRVAEESSGDMKEALIEAYEQVEEQEDEHLYHSRGYCRELWLDALGLPAMLPPPEEMEHVRSAISAAQAQQQSERNR